MSTTAPAPPTGYRLAVPAWWDRVDLTSPHREDVVERIVARQFRGIDDAPLARREATRLLQDQVRQAHDVGGLELHLSVRAVAGVVLPASLLVHVVPADAVPVGEGATAWTGGAGAGTRRRRERLLDGGTAGPVATTVLEHHVPVPAGLTPVPALLALTATTTSGALADHLVGLFDAIAATLRWTS